MFHQDGLCMITVLANRHVYRQVTGLIVYSIMFKKPQRPNLLLSRVRSQNTPTFLLHSQLSFESLFLATLQDASTNLQQPASFLTRYIQQQATYDRTGRWETHGHAHTHAAAPGCSHRDETFPKRVNHRTIQMVQCIIPNATSNLPHYLAGVYSNDHRWVLAKQLTGTQL